MFGLKSVWWGQVKVSVSDSTRTILDMLNDPRLGKKSGIIGINIWKAQNADTR